MKLNKYRLICQGGNLSYIFNAAIRNSAGEYLLAHHTYPISGSGEFWGLPGGAMERNEPPPSALYRELDKELGLKALMDKLLVVDTSEENLLDFFYECDFREWEEQTSEEVDAHRYYSIDHLPSGMSKRHSEVLRIIELHRTMSGDFPVYYGEDGFVFDRNRQRLYNIRISPETLYYIDALIAPESIPEKEDCLLCGTQMQRAMVGYAFPERDPIVRTRAPVPGYRCGACEAEYYEESVGVLLFERTVPILEAAGKHQLKASVERRLAILRGEVGGESTSLTRHEGRSLRFDAGRA